ncbi:MAG: hypothetical protein AMJ42_05700 [Deltaproteobacteria bacterium DG_8]|nr:MAG: hypothetical protein AMJ42_05700 [Deltaproteobacteria bacterium DG_8]
MVAGFDKAIPPGQEGKVTLKVNTNNRKGRLNQSAIIFSNDPRNPKTKISMSGLIKQYINVEPSTRVILQGYYGEKIKKQLTITSLEEQPFKIKNITTDIDDKIEYTLKTIEKEKEYSLEIKTRSGIKESFRGKVVLKINSQKKPEVNLFIMGKLQNEVKVAPQYLYFGIIDTSKEVTDPKSFKRSAMVSRFRGGDLTIKNIETSRDWIVTETETNEKGKKYTIVINLSKNKLPKGKFREKITIHTEYSKRSEAATLIIEGKVI